MANLSGKDWVSKFPTSKEIGALSSPFSGNVKKFVDALHAAKAKVEVSATLRPPARAYLMHYAFKVAQGLDPAKVPPMPGVDIDWVHKDASGNADLKASTQAAAEMVSAYDIAYEPALKSHHSEGKAIDMNISWSGDLAIKDAKGNMVTIKSSPRNGGNKELHAIGAGYGVIKLVSDPPHWSSDGH